MLEVEESRSKSNMFLSALPLVESAYLEYICSLNMDPRSSEGQKERSAHIVFLNTQHAAISSPHERSSNRRTSSTEHLIPAHVLNTPIDPPSGAS
jgi:hypothetical protein